MKNVYLSLIVYALFCCTACKKDKLTIRETRTYSQANHISTGPYDGGWQLTLEPNGVADILPGGDIIYSGTYKISGNTIKIKSDGGSFEFKIISESEIKEVKYGTILNLKPNF